MAEQTSRVQCALKAQFNPASLTGSYQPLNGAGTQSDAAQAGFSDAIRILKIYNPSTTVSIDISFDGVNDHDFIPPLSTLIIDFQANHNTGPTFSGGQWNVSKYQILFGKTAAHPTFLQMIGYL
jgi:hypothetical protein